MLKLENVNKFILFSPFLLLYLVIVIFFSNSSIIGDEARYLSFAKNLSHGFFSPPPPHINLDNGPGYPLILVLFVKLHLPVFFMRLLNPFFLYLAVLLIFKTCNFYLDFKKSFFFACLFGLYYPFYQYLVILYTEVIAVFLFSFFVYLVHKPKNTSLQSLFLPAFILAYLALTKVFFGYLIVLSVVGLSVFYLYKKSIEIKKLLYIALLSFSLCVPYLAYTYSLTGEILYWGGNRDALYWMASPHKEELGDWNPRTLRDNPALIKNHIAFMDSTENFTYMAQNEAYTNEAIKNIKKHPQRYIFNVFANVGRTFFNYPFSYNRHGNIWHADLAYMLINMFLVVPFFVIIIMFLFNLRRTPIALGFLLLFILAYFGASMLVYADKRTFFPIIPFIVTSAAFYLSQFKIERIH